MLTEEQIMKSKFYMEQHLDMNLTLHTLAQQAGYSESHFSRNFKQSTGYSVTEYLKKRRLIKASKALLCGHKILDTALRFGWQTHSSFTKAFKQEFGFSPIFLKAMLLEINYLGGNAMTHVFLKSYSENNSPEYLYHALKEVLETSWDAENLLMLEKTYQIAKIVYAGQKRYSGEAYLTHPLQVALILTEMEAEPSVICASLLCDVLKKTVTAPEYLKQHLPKNIANIVMAANTYSIEELIDCKNDSVLMLKLAERLHNMRTINHIKDSEKPQKASETLRIYLPLARRLGNRKLLDELNELALNDISLDKLNELSIEETNF